MIGKWKWKIGGYLSTGSLVGIATLVASSSRSTLHAESPAPQSSKSVDKEEEISIDKLNGILNTGTNIYGVIDPLLPNSLLFRTPHRLGFFNGMKFRTVAMGEKHAAAVDSNGDVYQWGAACVGVGTDGRWDAHDPVLSLKGKDIVSLSIDNSNVYALSSSGKIIILKSNLKEEQVRREEVRKKAWFPSLTDGLVYLSTGGAKVEEITSGDDYVVARTRDGKVYFGASHPSGIKHLGTTASSRQSFLIPTSLPEDGASHKLGLISFDEKIKQVSSGSAHILALGESGRVYGWGSNGFGQLGLGDIGESAMFQADPIEIKSVWSVSGDTDIPKSITHAPGSITRVSAAGDTSFFIKQSKVGCDVYACGFGQYGQLGYGSFLHIAGSPVRVKRLSFLSQFDESQEKSTPLIVDEIIGGWRHAVAVLKTSRISNDEKEGESIVYGDDLLSWGSNMNGECLVSSKAGAVVSPSLMTPLRSGNDDRLQISYVKEGKDKKKATIGISLGKCATSIYSK